MPDHIGHPNLKAITKYKNHLIIKAITNQNLDKQYFSNVIKKLMIEKVILSAALRKIREYTG